MFFVFLSQTFQVGNVDSGRFCVADDNALCLITRQRIGSLSNVTEPRAPLWSCCCFLFVVALKIQVGRCFCRAYVYLDVLCSLCRSWSHFQVVMGIPEAYTFFPFLLLLLCFTSSDQSIAGRRHFLCLRS